MTKGPRAFILTWFYYYYYYYYYYSRLACCGGGRYVRCLAGLFVVCWFGCCLVGWLVCLVVGWLAKLLFVQSFGGSVGWLDRWHSHSGCYGPLMNVEADTGALKLFEDR